MQEVKRVLWVDDYPENRVNSMFLKDETKNVSTMDEAINEIAGEHLYDYDTIVLDIDFENGLPNGEKNIIEKLSGKIYLNKDQRDKNFIINNGGYLLFLYLLEKGYPSEQVAFLTGNVGIISQLKAYHQQSLGQMSREEIFEAFVSAWGENSEDLDAFEEKINALPVDKKYKDSDFVYDCAELLDGGDIKGVRNKIEEVVPTMVTGNLQNTGDMMIFRFHEANLESPAYFSKNENDIEGHNRKDAQKWLDENRTDDRLTRWLLLYVGNYVEQLFKSNPIEMGIQVGNIFVDISGDPGIRSSFRQMYFVFDGLRNIQRRGVYYQAVSAMLIPFDNKPQSSDPKVNPYNNGDDKIRNLFARFSKQARNYCAHNYFGSSISNQTTLYLLMGTVTAVLVKNQREGIGSWYQNVREKYKSDTGYSIADNRNKIDTLIDNLEKRGQIDKDNAHTTGKLCQDYNAWEMLRAFGYNDIIKTQESTTVREKYYLFTLAAYIVKWFDGLDEELVGRSFGSALKSVYELSNEIVNDYGYPTELLSV